MTQASTITLKPAADKANKSSWRGELAFRFLHDWKLKGSGTTGFVALFFVAYLWLQRSPFFEAAVMPEIWLDEWVAFQPWALTVYVTLWLYVSLPAALQETRRGLLLYGAWSGVVALIGLSIFALWPTTLAVPDIDWSKHPGYTALKSIDAAGNACPSLHVAFAVFSGMALDRVWAEMRSSLWLRLGSAAWGATIVVSTMATKQHVALDVAAGLVLGVIGGGLFLRQAMKTPYAA